MKELSLTGKVFKEVKENIITKHGFNSNKMVARRAENFINERDNHWNNIFNKMTNEELINTGIIEDNPIGYFENTLKWIKSVESGRKAYQEFEKCVEELVKMGYVKTWDKKITETMSKLYIGLTPKGWSVANKY